MDISGTQNWKEFQLGVLNVVHPIGINQERLSKMSFKKGNVSWNTGLTKETDERVAKAGNNIKIVLTGRCLSLEHRLHCSLALKGKNTWSKGRTLTEEHKSKCGAAQNEAICRSLSTGLRAGVDPLSYIEQLRGINVLILPFRVEYKY